MKLVVDIGNSRLKWNHVDKGPWQAGQSVSLQDDLDALLDEIWRDAPLPEIILVSNVSGARVWIDQNEVELPGDGRLQVTGSFA